MPLTLAQALIRCPSITPEDAGVLGVLEAALTPLGFTCHRVRFEETGTPPVENLYARWGTASPNLCFAGHTDVVPVGDASAWTYPPFSATVADGVLYGRGAVDMKGAIAAFVSACREVIANSPPQGSVSLLITNDEEGPAINGTRKMLDWLRGRGERIDACIVGEPTNPDQMGEMIKIGRRGSLSAHLTIHGTQGHAAYPDRADNPVRRMVHLLHALQTHGLDKGTDYFDASRLEITSVDVGNPASNVIPAKAEARFNIRFNDRHSSVGLIAWLHEVIARHAPRYDLRPHASGEAFLTPPGPLSELVASSVEKITGTRPVLSTSGGTSDARFIKDICPVVECGLISRTAHHIDECIRVDELEMLTRVYVEVLLGYGG